MYFHRVCVLFSLSNHLQEARKYQLIIVTINIVIKIKLFIVDAIQIQNSNSNSKSCATLMANLGDES